ncbi:hypothetical protein BD413DRAFT_616321 [Trametes elegans]|nr:hypothetical protein BD413DRAFT_616321 [Trametes elegans]
MLHRGFEIWISDSGGQRLPEFGVELEGNDQKTMACCIPSERGKAFVIHSKEYNGMHVSVRHCIDGTYTISNVVYPYCTGTRAGIRTVSEDTYSPLLFADLPTTGAGALEKLGTIEVRVVRIHPTTARIGFTPAPFAGVGAVHERSKKLGAHCVTLGERVKIQGRVRGRVRSTPLDPREGPYVSFVFRYRPAALLQAQGIMPPPAPAGAAVGGRRGNAPRAGVDAFRHAEVEVDVKPRVKPEPRSQVMYREVIELLDDDDDDVPELGPEDEDRKPVLHGVKREPDTASQARSKLKTGPDGVIDLTLDD